MKEKVETNPGSLQNLKYQTIKPEGDVGIGFQHRAPCIPHWSGTPSRLPR